MGHNFHDKTCNLTGLELMRLKEVNLLRVIAAEVLEPAASILIGPCLVKNSTSWNEVLSPKSPSPSWPSLFPPAAYRLPHAADAKEMSHLPLGKSTRFARFVFFNMVTKSAFTSQTLTIRRSTPLSKRQFCGWKHIIYKRGQRKKGQIGSS